MGSRGGRRSKGRMLYMDGRRRNGQHGPVGARNGRQSAAACTMTPPARLSSRPLVKESVRARSGPPDRPSTTMAGPAARGCRLSGAWRSASVQAFAPGNDGRGVAVLGD